MWAGKVFVPLEMKGCICHITKWQIHPFISKRTMCAASLVITRETYYPLENLIFLFLANQPRYSRLDTVHQPSSSPCKQDTLSLAQCSATVCDAGPTLNKHRLMLARPFTLPGGKTRKLRLTDSRCVSGEYFSLSIHVISRPYFWF